jgi:hypothetical protein
MALPLETLKDRAAGDAQLARFGLDLDCAEMLQKGVEIMMLMLPAVLRF